MTRISIEMTRGMREEEGEEWEREGGGGGDGKKSIFLFLSFLLAFTFRLFARRKRSLQVFQFALYRQHESKKLRHKNRTLYGHLQLVSTLIAQSQL